MGRHERAASSHTSLLQSGPWNCVYWASVPYTNTSLDAPILLTSSNDENIPALVGDDIISLCRQRFPALRLFLIIRLHISRSTALPFHTESVWTIRHLVAYANLSCHWVLVAVLYCTLSVLGEQPKSVPLLLRESVSALLSKTTYSGNECPDIVFPA